MEYPLKEFTFALVYNQITNFYTFEKLYEYLTKLEKETNCKINFIPLEINEIEEKTNTIKKLDMVTSEPKEVKYLLKVLQKFKDLTWVHSMFSGVDKFIIQKEIRENPKIILTNARGAFSTPLAEYTILSMLYFNYNIPLYIESQKNHEWNRLTNTMIDQKTICIIGYGKNGVAIAKRVKNAFNMKVIGFVRKLREDIEGKELVDEMYGFDQFSKEIINKADFVLATLPETKESKGLFDKKFFEWMKKDGVFINIGRGSAVVEEDLIEALDKNIIRGAVIDVCQHEPLDKSDKLYDVPNNKLLITNHSGDFTTLYIDQSYDPLIQNIRRYIQEGKLVTIVKKDLGY